MVLHINRKSPIPVYLQISEQIKHLIAAGRLRPGEQLPTLQQLAVALGVNRNTVARAYKKLHREGVVSSRQGRRTFVSEQSDQLQLAQMRREKLGAIFDKSLVEALSRGYSMQEIEQAVIEQLTRWWTETNSSDPLQVDQSQLDEAT